MAKLEMQAGKVALEVPYKIDTGMKEILCCYTYFKNYLQT